MTMGESADAGARVRWLVAGTFTPNPTGALRAVTADGFAQLLADNQFSVKAQVPDRLGDGETRTIEASFTKLKSFTLAEVIGAVPLLAELRSLGDALGSADLSKRPEADVALAKVLELVGNGKLSAELAKALAPPKSATTPASPAAGAPASTSASAGGDAVDAIFAQAGVETPASAGRAAIDAFIRASRAASGNKPKVNTAQGRDARAVIEAAVYGTASDLLKDSVVAQLEGAWRGLKLLIDQCPHSAGMRVDLVDTTPDKVAEAMRAHQAEDAVDRYDAFVVVDAIDDPTLLASVAATAEEQCAPAIVSVTHALFGAEAPTQVSLRIEDDNGNVVDGWSALRADESSRWLCAAFNRVVAVSDGAGSMRRAVFASPALALAAMLAASYRNTGTFGRLQGAPGALRAPGTHELTQGKDAGTAVPTEAFLSVRAQARLAQLGVLGLGSGRNSDAVMVTHAPTVRGGDDLVPLPAQILTGRIVRFAQWVRDQVPAGSPDADVINLFEQAAGVFLFPGMTEGAKLTAQLADDKAGGRAVIVTASVRAELAGSPFHMAFQLPLANS